jgi:hypothetical protein
LAPNASARDGRKSGHLHIGHEAADDPATTSMTN